MNLLGKSLLALFLAVPVLLTVRHAHSEEGRPADIWIGANAAGALFLSPTPQIAEEIPLNADGSSAVPNIVGLTVHSEESDWIIVNQSVAADDQIYLIQSVTMSVTLEAPDLQQRVAYYVISFVDRTAPEIFISQSDGSPINLGPDGIPYFIYPNLPVFTVEAFDGVDGEVPINQSGRTHIDFAALPSPLASLGHATLSLSAVDSSGNVAQKSFTYAVRERPYAFLNAKLTDYSCSVSLEHGTKAAVSMSGTLQLVPAETGSKLVDFDRGMLVLKGRTGDNLTSLFVAINDTIPTSEILSAQSIVHELSTCSPSISFSVALAPGAMDNCPDMLEYRAISRDAGYSDGMSKQSLRAIFNTPGEAQDFETQALYEPPNGGNPSYCQASKDPDSDSEQPCGCIGEDPTLPGEGECVWEDDLVTEKMGKGSPEVQEWNYPLGQQAGFECGNPFAPSGVKKGYGKVEILGAAWGSSPGGEEQTTPIESESRSWVKGSASAKHKYFRNQPTNPTWADIPKKGYPFSLNYPSDYSCNKLMLIANRLDMYGRGAYKVALVPPENSRISCCHNCTIGVNGSAAGKINVSRKTTAPDFVKDTTAGVMAGFAHKVETSCPPVNPDNPNDNTWKANITCVNPERPCGLGYVIGDHGQVAVSSVMSPNDPSLFFSVLSFPYSQSKSFGDSQPINCKVQNSCSTQTNIANFSATAFMVKPWYFTGETVSQGTSAGGSLPGIPGGQFGFSQSTQTDKVNACIASADSEASSEVDISYTPIPHCEGLLPPGTFALIKWGPN